MINQQILYSTRKKPKIEKIGYQPMTQTSLWFMTDLESDINNLLIDNSFIFQTKIIIDLQHLWQMVLSLDKEKLYLDALKENYKVKLKLHNLLVILPKTLLIIMVRCLWQIRLLEWLKILLGLITLIYLCQTVSLVLEIQVVRITLPQDIFLPT